METFKAYVVRQDEKGQVRHGVEDQQLSFLSKADTLIRVEYSSLNYKDMLALETNGGVIRNYPMIPGIDLSGVVIESENENYRPGDSAIATGYDLGITHTGGFAQIAQVPSDWLIKLPKGLSLKEAMIYGTAGFTAAQSILALEGQGMTVDKQPKIVVTGASGGVGSIALQILKKIGYQDLSATIRKDYQIDFVEKLGANSVWDVSQIGKIERPLAKRRFDYAIDAVGGNITANLLAVMNENASIALSGNAGGVSLETTVLPFILRGVNLLGINSVNVNQADRQLIWQKLANEWKVSDFIQYQEIQLDEIADKAQQLREGTHLGRTIIKL